MNKVTVRIKCLDSSASLPVYMSEKAAGMDVCSSVDTVLCQGEIQVVPTGIAIELPDGYEAQIRPRSGLACKYGISIPNAPGTIDADYRGEIKIILINLGQAPFEIHKGDRIAQMVVAPVVQVMWEEVEELNDSVRSAGGFGHTGT